MIRHPRGFSVAIQLAAVMTAGCQATAPQMAGPAAVGPAAVAGSAAAASAPARSPRARTDTEYAVGPGQTYARLNDVPWEELDPGTTVRIFWREAPYHEKFVINRSGTVDRPIRILGMPGPAGQRPVIDGKGATTRAHQIYRGTGQGPKSDMQNLGVIVLDGTDYNAPRPEYIVVDGLHIRGGTSSNSFTGTAGDARTYEEGAACIRVQKGAHLVFHNNEISDCDNGLFSQTQEDWDEAKKAPNESTVTRDILIDGNYIHGHGTATGGSTDRYHNSYIQSVGVVYQYNHYGPQRRGGHGSALKDRSIGTVVRFNRIEGCARSLDLVEAENSPHMALLDPAYRETFVYGNIIQHDNDVGVAIHYGGDHYGGDYPTGSASPPWTTANSPWPASAYGESFFRQGTLYFYGNTVIINASGEYGTAIFQLSTTLEHAQIFNNVFWMAGSPQHSGLMAPTRDIGKFWKAGGTVNLGVNLFNKGWSVDPDPGANHASHAVVTGTAKMLTTATMPIDPTTFQLVRGSAGIDAAQSPEAWPSVGAHPVDREYTDDLQGRARVLAGKAMDLGARESP